MASAGAAPPPVLVVEDDPAIAGLFAWVLRNLGCDPVVTADAILAVQWVAARPFALAVLDFHVRNGTGLDVARAIRGRGNDTPILMASGSWSPDLRDEALRVSGLTLMDKPVDLEQFRRTAEALLGSAPH